MQVVGTMIQQVQREIRRFDIIFILSNIALLRKVSPESGKGSFLLHFSLPSSSSAFSYARSILSLSLYTWKHTKHTLLANEDVELFLKVSLKKKVLLVSIDTTSFLLDSHNFFHLLLVPFLECSLSTEASATPTEIITVIPSRLEVG